MLNAYLAYRCLPPVGRCPSIEFPYPGDAPLRCLLPLAPSPPPRALFFRCFCGARVGVSYKIHSLTVFFVCVCGVVAVLSFLVLLVGCSRVAFSLPVRLQLVKECGPKWSAIATRLGNEVGKHCRVGKQIRDRYLQHLDPNLKKGSWTPEEVCVCVCVCVCVLC